MADRCPVCNDWMNTTSGGVHNCPGDGSRTRVELQDIGLPICEEEVPQLFSSQLEEDSVV
ncbi:unnamed protein product [Clonostachys rhizophaga]|uniref:Uncharacterized protein n=1 Tax=Clonostachys rhizophaga TaxID=160324 RepID=A0A9N9V2V4_9HYPO|nr:unnamed protein product [Clonostachys rhizophaga]